MNRKFLHAVWTASATLAALWLGWEQYHGGSAVNRLAAREQLDTFMLEVRANYQLYCDQSSDVLRPVMRSRYEALIDVAAVDAFAAPYDRPCRRVEAPADPTVPPSIAITPSSAIVALNYADWESFINQPNKQAVLWISGVPITVDVSKLDWRPIESSYRALVREKEDCVNDLQNDSENTFLYVECRWFVDEHLNFTLMSVGFSNQ